MVVKKLHEYAKKRNFKKTPEPKPRVKKDTAQPIFVIQEHHASHLHYDFRLESQGVLKSWAVPKGPSTDPHIKRLAALTEDHPMDYATFEGIIPSGYGAGTVIVWDTGTYENASEKDGKPISVAAAFEKGHIKFILHGTKLKGGYALIRFHNSDKNWLLIKTDDDYADARANPVATKSKSVLSTKTIKSLDKKFKRP
jgi:DNA ligase D-like protein (predicted 3'-phosphoesterase)